MSHHAHTTRSHCDAVLESLSRLEETVYFQDKTIKELNEALTQQQFQLEALEKKMAQAQERLEDVQQMLDQGGEATVPPHSVQKAF